MSTRVNPDLIKEMSRYGMGSSWNACFHCGNCTAVCSLTEEGILFPRKEIRALQMGLTNKLASSPEPWMCYYCGDCSETCPRDANPGELMMSLRRYLTSVYDWTGLSGLFYTSLPALVIAFILVAISIIGIGFAKQFNIELIMDFGHHFEKIAIISVFTLILLPNIFRMFWFTILKEKIKAPFFSYVKGIWDLILHMFTQKNTLKCEKNTFRWFEHFVIVIGYLLLLFTTIFLNWFSTENTFVIWLGYIVGGVIFIFTFDFILGRIKKNKEINKFSHPSDWLFVIWLFFMALTAFIVRIFIDTDLISNNVWLYIVHLIILAQWAILIVPFGKWTHFLYRSFAIYFASIKKAGHKS
ncbi:MAG: 4Fe-4S dicluster domain-containing protein [Bacteroidales bacterium]|nr:4Fe-4S dicluster domain-containing protein [Bacteroidales bacterium]